MKSKQMGDISGITHSIKLKTIPATNTVSFGFR